MVTVQGINHIALDVPDADEAVDFYTDVFDAEVMNREGQNAWLDFNGRFDFLALFEDPDIDRPPQGWTLGTGGR
jgi:catechol 2,3-dioxygenase-like lactoylglutathione lyase family enzyme